jgi:hypothetical protein
MALLCGIPLCLLMSVSTSSGSSSLFVIVSLFLQSKYNYISVLNYLKFHTSSVWRPLRHAFFNECLEWFKIVPTYLETLGLCVPNLSLGDFTLFSVDLKHHRYPSARYTLAAPAISRDIGYSMEVMF